MAIPEEFPAQWPPRESNGRWRIDPRLAVSIIGWIVSVMLAWGLVNSRVSVVESKQQEAERRLERIEQKLDTLILRP